MDSDGGSEQEGQPEDEDVSMDEAMEDGTARPAENKKKNKKSKLACQSEHSSRVS